VLDDYTKAPIDARLRATLAYLEKLTRTPDAIGAADVRALVEQGVTKEAILEANYVCYLFCIYDRLADALDWDVPSTAAFEASARMLLKRGYG
jgi:alkylhydroperoxidase family enzyme